MEKIKLKDGTLIEIIGATSNSFTCNVATSQEFTTAYDKLTPSNLQSYSIVNEAGEALAFFNDKEVKSARLEGGIATFDLRDVDLNAKKITAQQAEIELLKQCTKELSSVVYK